MYLIYFHQKIIFWRQWFDHSCLKYTECQDPESFHLFCPTPLAGLFRSHDETIQKLCNHPFFVWLMLLTFGQMTRHQGHFLIYEDDANFARLSKDQDCEGKFIIVRRADRPGRFPCCVLLALSWNTNETQMKIQVRKSWLEQSTSTKLSLKRRTQQESCEEFESKF